MPEYLSPGVYVEEVATGPRPIEGVSTSTVGFVGLTERGPTAPRLVTSWLDFQRWYGDFNEQQKSYLPFAVRGFFDNQGQRAFIARVTGTGAGTANTTLEGEVADGNPATSIDLEAVGPGIWGENVFIRVTRGSQNIPNSSPPHYRLIVLYYSDTPPLPLVDPLEPDNIRDPNRREPSVVEDFDDLVLDPTGNRYLNKIVNNTSQLVAFDEEEGWQPGPPTSLPVSDTYTRLAGGDNGSGITDQIFTGQGSDSPDQRTGLAGLEAIDEISLLCVPDEVNKGLIPDDMRSNIRSAIVNQCERLRDRFAILQVEGGRGDIGDIPSKINIDTSYAAIYYPWIRVFNSRTQDNQLVPPGGHIAGVYARTDINRGVHKAPANETLNGIITQDLPGNRRPLEYHLSKGEHDILNPRGINVIRDFRSDGRGIRVWGARTLSSDSQWRYVNVRRLFLFIEESIEEGTQWVVFEPNYEPTWASVNRSVTNFLISVWRSGALAGVTQDEAFFVKCDRTTMTQDDIDSGRLICYVGVAPVKPAEFVIFRISQKTLDASA